MNTISETDLILNPDGSAYHIGLLPENVAGTIITVGDPDRVQEVSKYFDRIECRKGKREFITHVGYISKKRITVISTGIGTDNIEIVLSELDALVNINLKTRVLNPVIKSLDIIRIGTSGAIQPEIPVDSLLISTAALGLDPLLNYYKQELHAADQDLLSAFTKALPVELNCNPYFVRASDELLSAFAKNITQGITLTAPGFYAPQGRVLRGKQVFPDLLSVFTDFNFSGKKVANLEMETAGIYGLATALGHNALSFNIILANRATQQFSKDTGKITDHFIHMILEMISGYKD